MQLDGADDFATSQKKPRIPREFYRKSLLGASGLIGFMLLMFVVPTALNYCLLIKSTWPLWTRIVLSLPGFLLAGQGVHLMGWIGHDGFHFTFHENRHVCTTIALLFSSMTLFFFQSGMAIDHWSHHRFANTEKDPDLRLLRHHKTFWRRLFKQRNRANAHYFARTLTLAFGRPLPADIGHVKLPFRQPVLRVLAWVNICFVVGWFSVYIYIETRFPGFVLIGVIVPLIIGSWLSGLRSFTEHADTKEGDLFNSRSRTHWLLTAIEYGGNYHLEHHLYPSVPQWRLPKLHRWLVSDGYYDRLPDPTVIDPSMSVYKYALGRYAYGRKTTLTDSLTVPPPALNI